MCNKSNVKCRESRNIFQFGDGCKLKSKGEYWLPAVLADKEVAIKTDVVESDVPLLLSKRSMKRARVKIDIEKDTASIFGKNIALKVTSSGQYCVPIGSDKTDNISRQKWRQLKREENKRIVENGMIITHVFDAAATEKQQRNRDRGTIDDSAYRQEEREKWKRGPCRLRSG